MNLTQLVYVSRRSHDLSDAELREIIAQSQRRNRSRDITGVLMLCGDNIMQLLEGDGSVIEPLYTRIAADPRHRDVHQLLRKSVRTRLYPEWGMKLIDPGEQTILDRQRLSRMISDIQALQDTKDFSIESRVLLNDFRQQLDKVPGVNIKLAV